MSKKMCRWQRQAARMKISAFIKRLCEDEPRWEERWRRRQEKGGGAAAAGCGRPKVIVAIVEVD